jgi:hypothetical protein
MLVVDENNRIGWDQLFNSSILNENFIILDEHREKKNQSNKQA